MMRPMDQSAADPSFDATGPLRVAVDATPLMNRKTGVGAMTAALFTQLGRCPEVDLTGYVVSWRARKDHRLIEAMPTAARPLPVVWPARLVHRLWRRLDHPRLPGSFDVVHGTNYVVPPTGAGARLVTVHDLTAWRFPHLVHRYSRANPSLLSRAVASGADVHCVSRAVGREIVEDLRVPSERVHVVPNGFDPVGPGDGAAARRRVGGPYVLAIGTVEPRKDYVGLLTAMNTVWTEHPDVRLVIIGGDGWGIDSFRDAVRQSMFRHRVIRTGYVSDQDKADYVAGAELLAYPSVYEGFGLPVLEAMEAGLPVVATAVAAVTEVAGDGALLVPPGEPDRLAAAIASVLTDDQRRADLVSAGRTRAARYSWARSGSAMIELYRRLTS